MKNKILAVIFLLAALSLSGCGEGENISSGVNLTDSSSSSERSGSSSEQGGTSGEQSSTSSEQSSTSSEQSSTSSERRPISTAAPTSAPVTGGDRGDESDYETQLKDGGVIITKYMGGGGDLVVPSVIGGRRVTEIGGGAFAKRADITSITLPGTVTEIEEYAFRDCIALRSADLGGAAEIDEGAFYGCAALRSIDAGFVDEISDFAFYGCGGLESVNLPRVTDIGENAFEGCTSLRSVSFGERLDEIDDRAFSGCTRLGAITLPDRIDELGKGVFDGCRDVRITYKGEIFDCDRQNDLRMLINGSRSAD